MDIIDNIEILIDTNLIHEFTMCLKGKDVDINVFNTLIMN